MTVKFLIQRSLEKMNVQDFTKSSLLTDREKLLQQALIYSLVAVSRELLAEYIPLQTKEKVVFKDKKLSAKELDKHILYPISLVKDSKRIEFQTDAENIYAAENGEMTLTYAYMPETELALSTEVNFIGASDDLITDGMLAQYYFASGMYELAKSYDASYREKLWRLKYKGKELKLKAGRWSK